MASPSDVSRYQRTEFQALWVADFLLRAPQNPTCLVILLHGFSQTGEKIFRKLEGVLPPDAAVLAPCAPFPLPRLSRSQNDEGHNKAFELGYSWYFYDSGADEYWIDARVAVSFIEGLIRKLGLSGLDTDLIGFSQGGYVAPFVAEKIPSCRHVIGIASEFLVEELIPPTSIHPKLRQTLQMDQIHGKLDDVVDFERAKAAHAKLIDQGFRGRFYALPETGHRIDSRVQAVVKEIYEA